MDPRIALVSAAALLACAGSVPMAYAAPAEPRLDPALLKEAAGMVKSVDLGPERAVITVDGSDPITLDWGDLAGGSENVRVIGYASGAALGLGLLSRLLRVLRMLAGFRSRDA